MNRLFKLLGFFKSNKNTIQVPTKIKLIPKDILDSVDTQMDHIESRFGRTCIAFLCNERVVGISHKKGLEFYVQ
jgi:hypothetical protein